jgi:hypothetical protein
MTKAKDYASVMGRKPEIMLKSVGIDYANSSPAPLPSITKNDAGNRLHLRRNAEYPVQRQCGKTPIWNCTI